jgi:hypothetical protein
MKEVILMTTRIDPSGPPPAVIAQPTASRTTAQPTRPFQAMMQAGASAVVSGAESAVRRLPGGSVLAAALRPTGTTLNHHGGAATTPEGYPTPGSATPGAPGTGGDPSVEGMLDQNADRNLYYIALQERISAENRLYTAFSNVLRVRHETMKNAIGNFR